MNFSITHIALDWQNATVIQAIVTENFNHPAYAEKRSAEKGLFLNELGVPKSHALFMYQSHSIDHAFYDKNDTNTDSIGELHHTISADALSTSIPTIHLSVTTADCLPIMLCFPDIPLVSIIHAGFRGLLDGIIQQTIGAVRTKYPEKAKNCVAYIGPHIQACCYNNDQRPSLIETFKTTYGNDVIHNKTHINLTQAACTELHNQEVRDISISESCTCCDPELPSHYRDGEAREKTLIHVINLR